MKLVYWKARVLRDRDNYSIRARTRKEAERLRDTGGSEYYDKPVKVTITYTDAFDLVQQLLGEGYPE